MADFSERLKESDARRAAWIRKFGVVPTSVLKVERGPMHKRVRHWQMERGQGTNGVSTPTLAASAVRTKGNMTKREAARVGVSSAGSRGKTDAYSIMSADLVAFFAKYYAKPGDLYFDPFAGHGVRGQVAKLLGLGYVGQDVCAKFCAFTRAVFAEMDDGATRLELHEQTSERAVLADNEADFSFTSPPYWDLELYDDAPEQLGVGHTYGEFMEGLKRVGAEVLRVLKPGAFYVLNVNDFRKAGRFYPYHADCLTAHVQVGFAVHDIWVLAGGVVSGGAQTFGVSFNEKRIAPKVHEYALVFRKPLAVT